MVAKRSARRGEGRGEGAGKHIMIIMRLIDQELFSPEFSLSLSLSLSHTHTQTSCTKYESDPSMPEQLININFAFYG